MEKIIFATGNEHKMIEIRAILSDLGAEILSQKEAGIKADVVEDGATFEENAMIKATEIAKIANQMPEYKNAVVLADDSGLEIDYLNKEPGIYSARYMGEDTSYDIKNQTLLDRLEALRIDVLAAGYVRWQRPCRMVPLKWYEVLWRELLAMRSREKTDLGMIRYSSFRSMAVQAQNFHRKRKMN